MGPALLVRLRPLGPWRIGPDSGARDRVDSILHSDALYSALCSAFARVGLLDEWLAATFGNTGRPEVRLSSLFPSIDGTLFVVPPRSIWPPAASTRVRWKGAKFVPLKLVESILAGESLVEGRWTVDGPSECLVPSDRPRGPFRTSLRSAAALDRLLGGVEPHATACLEFSDGAALWAVAAFADQDSRERWAGRIQGAFRLLADSGFGGERSHGWGRSAMPEFTEGVLPDLILPAREPAAPPSEGEAAPVPETAWWLLSLFSPAPEDSVDWSRGNYTLVIRGGRVESSSEWGAPKKLTRMIAEGSVLCSELPIQGMAHDVSPDGFPHPVYRAGYALAIPIPLRVTP
jgi:CRISPR type III-A-associated RAMP protein Csm4